ncbi:hypothetical protein ES703_105711 [subsurface metagenome]
MRREKYILAGFSIHQRKAVQYSEYVTLNGLAKGLKSAMARGCDYVSIRRIRQEAGS